MKTEATRGPYSAEKAQQLLEQCANGDRQAFDSLARWCLPRVRRTIILSYGGGPEHEDLIQIAMAKIFSRLHTFRGDASFFVWVDRITINVVKDSFKKRRFLLFADNPEDFDHRGQIDQRLPEQEIDKYRLFERLAELFETIAPKRRVPLVLSLMQGYTVPEIAAITDVSFDTAKMRLRRGRSDLLRKIKKDPFYREALRGWTK